MSILYRLTPEQLKADGFVYEGRFAGLIPIYIGNLDTDFPEVTTRNWVPEWTLDLTINLFVACAYVVDACGGHCPGFPVDIYRRLDGTPLQDDPALN